MVFEVVALSSAIEVSSVLAFGCLLMTADWFHAGLRRMRQRHGMGKVPDGPKTIWRNREVKVYYSMIQNSTEKPQLNPDVRLCPAGSRGLSEKCLPLVASGNNPLAGSGALSRIFPDF